MHLVERNQVKRRHMCLFGYFYKLLQCWKILRSQCDSLKRLCLPDLAVLQGKDAIQEHHKTNQSCRKQHPCVPAEPGEI